MKAKFVWRPCIAGLAGFGLLAGCGASDVAAPTSVALSASSVSASVAHVPEKPTPKLKPTPTVVAFKTEPAKGLSEAQRRKIFYELTGAEDRARHDADRVFSPDEDSSNNLAENDRLTERYKTEIIGHYRLSKAQVEAINSEGLNKSWPPLN